MSKGQLGRKAAGTSMLGSISHGRPAKEEEQEEKKESEY